MMLNVAEHAMEVEREWLKPGNWLGPSVLTLILLGELAYCTVTSGSTPSLPNAVGPKQVVWLCLGLTGSESNSHLCC